MQTMTKVTTTQDPANNHVVTVYGRRRKVLVRERFVHSEDARSFSSFCNSELKKQKGDKRA